MKTDFTRVILGLSGPITFAIIQCLPAPVGLENDAQAVLAITAWMAVWWVTEAVPLAVTSLLPILLFPLLHVMKLDQAVQAYSHKYIFLYMGGFMLAIAIERWNLHKRMALMIISGIGTNISSIILGFMLATAILSMWISNTATSVMMLPIGMAIVQQFNQEKSNTGLAFGKALMLAIAYSASIGGFATLIGTPPNLVLASVFEQVYDIQLSFWDWMKFGVPVSFSLLFICWLSLTRFVFDFRGIKLGDGKEGIAKMLHSLGNLSADEKAVMLVFLLTAFGWICRSYLQQWLPMLDDAHIALFGAIILFLIPSKSEKRALLTWDEAVKLPWGIILLFGGGIALARGFEVSGMSDWIATGMSSGRGFSILIVVFILVLGINFLTEITSNLATTAMFLPVLAPMAYTLDVHPYLLMVPVAMAASCAFMLPVATPPNAVVMGSGYLKIKDMMRAGLWLNLISVLIITISCYYLLELVWGFDPLRFPVGFQKPE
ncbi:SLC13 family permease [Algoriphagus resistens]|uniref:SLC13 family permease n=1 Tax=Algoriphagus resistens TaxID=1750590 RepID=UPI000716C156|nr:DASS family sodium-coupled anion symporter [Algoriphagus resistens]